MTPREGDGLLQLELALADSHVRVPWEGTSPRALTACYERFILKPRAGKSVSDPGRDENQYDLWLPMKRVPWKYQGAPLLVDLRGVCCG